MLYGWLGFLPHHILIEKLLLPSSVALHIYCQMSVVCGKAENMVDWWMRPVLSGHAMGQGIVCQEDEALCSRSSWLLAPEV